MKTIIKLDNILDLNAFITIIIAIAQFFNLLEIITDETVDRISAVCGVTL